MKVHKNKIVEYVRKNKIATSSEIAKEFNLSWNTADKYLLEILIDGKVERIKKQGVTLWMLK
jgi:predicted HTH transcriptional regulator